MNEWNTLSMPNIQPAAQNTPLVMPPTKETGIISFEGGNVSLTGYAFPQETPAHLKAVLRIAPHLAAYANYADTAMLDPVCADAESLLHIQLLMQKLATENNSAVSMANL